MSEKSISVNRQAYDLKSLAPEHTVPLDLVDFYLWRCPHAKSDKPSSGKSISLSDQKFKGTELLRLTGWIFSHFVSNGKSSLIYSAAKNINSLINDQNKDWSSPCLQGVLQINASVKVLPNNRCSLTVDETYISCFFRHVRNALAHGCFEVLDGGWLLLTDQSSKMGTADNDVKFSAKLKLSFEFMREIMDVVLQGNPSRLPTLPELKKQIGDARYQINITMLDVREKQEEGESQTPLRQTDKEDSQPHRLPPS